MLTYAGREEAANIQTYIIFVKRLLRLISQVSCLPPLLSCFPPFSPLFFSQFCGMKVSRGLVGVGKFGGVRLGLSYCAYTYVSMRQHTSAYAQRTSRKGWRRASWSVLFRC